jgi:hypothetical protein
MTSMEKILGEKISRESLTERIRLHFKEIFLRDWGTKDLGDLIGEGGPSNL